MSGLVSTLLALKSTATRIPAPAFEAAAMSEASDLDLDEKQLTAATVGQRGEVWLLTWLSKAEKALKTLSEDVVREHALKTHHALLRILTQAPTASAPAPKPARPVRALVSRCLDLLFARTDSRSLFDCIQTLSRAINDPKTEKDNRVASLHCAGHVMLTYGQQVSSQAADLVAGALRLLKSSSNPVSVRFTALGCIRNTLKSSGKALNDSVARDVLKSLRNTLSDKIAPLQCAASEAILAFYEAGLASLTLIDIESTLNTCLKRFENANFETRASFARLLAAMLSTTQIEGSGAVAKPASKKKAESGKSKDDGKDEADPYPTATQEKESSKTLLSLPDMLNLLSAPYCRPQTTRKGRVGLIAVYSALLSALGQTFVEAHYSELAQHIVEKVGRAPVRPVTGTSQAAQHQRYESLTNRKCANILLRHVVGVRLLSEQGQIAAIRDLASLYLNKWPSLLPGHPAPSKTSLLVALQETAGLLLQLGCAPTPVQDALYDPLVRLLEHPSYSVRAAAAWCLRCFCFAAPTRLAPVTSLLVELLNKDLSQLGTNDASSDLPSKTKGHAHALAALISVVPLRPLYSSYDTSARVMSLAVQLLKQASNHELHVSTIEIQIAWQLVTSLMALGPNFVRLHLPQLLILWKNSLPKSPSKDTSSSQNRPEAEWSFLLLIREWTLTSILSFLRHNEKLVSQDVSKRIVQLFGNALSFSTSFSSQSKHRLHEQSIATGSTLQLVDRDLFFRRRLFQCFTQLGDVAGLEAHAEALLVSALATFADPEVYTGSAVQAAIAASSGTFTSVWDTTDGFSFGVTCLLDDNGVHLRRDEPAKSWLNRDEVDLEIHALVQQPVMGALEHDPLASLKVNISMDEAYSTPPPATGVVDAAIELFALILPTQDLPTHMKVLEQLVSFVQSPKVERNPGRRMAILVNASVAVVGALRTTMMPASKKLGDSMAVPQVNKQLREIAKDAMIHSDSRLRNAGSEALGRLCQLAGTGFMSQQVQFCVTQVVSNTDPSGRAGCALALGQIYTHVGSLSAGPVLKTIFDILLSLSSDPHPLVHFWALQSLSAVINAASLSYAPFTNATLSAVTRLYMSDTHEPEGGSPASVNLRSDLPAYQAFCSVLDAVIGVMGPDLLVDERLQDLVLILLKEFKAEADEGIQVEAIKATHHFLIFAPDAVDLPSLLSDLRKHLSSPRQTLKNAAINSVYQLVQRNASLMSKLGGDKFAEELFTLLDEDPSVAGVRDALSSWLIQTVVNNPAGWIDLCQRIVSRTTASAQITSAASEGPAGLTFTDEESQGISLGEGQRAAKNTSRWRTQLFALQCTHLVFTTLQENGRREHFDAAISRRSTMPQRTLLIRRVSDLIKMAFTASTAPVMEIRLEGLVLLRDVIKSFSRTVDLDFDGAPLLEQYQAPIAAALTPAFSADSYPEVLSSAIQLCAVFIASGVVQEVPKMGRILKLLTSSLESCRDADMTSIGDFNNLTSTAAVMLKTSIFSAWAELQCASTAQPHLAPLMQPYLSLLCPAWLTTLKQYARLRSDADSVATSPATSSPGSQSFENSFSGLSREAALPYFEQAWRPMLGAIGSLLRQDQPEMRSALSASDDTTTQQEDMAGFYILYGLSFDMLASFNNMGRASSKAAAATASVALDVLESLVSRKIAGVALFQTDMFDELEALCFRLASTEPPPVQLRIVRLMACLAQEYPQELLQTSSPGTEPSQDEVLRETRARKCVRILVSMIQKQTKRGLVFQDPSLLQPTVALLESAWNALADVADLHPTEHRADFYAAAFKLYSDILQSSSISATAVSQTLPILKALSERAAKAQDRQCGLAIEAFLTSCLDVAEPDGEAKEDESSISNNNKQKSGLLAAVLVVTVLPEGVSVDRSSVDRLCALLVKRASQTGSEVQITALQCIRSLFQAAGTKSAPLQVLCVRQIVPSLLAKLLDVEVSKKLERSALLEFLRVLSAFPLAIPQQKAAMDISIPVLVTYLENSQVKEAAMTELLAIATSNPVAFKNTTVELSREQRTAVEAAIRQSAGSTSQPASAPAAGAAVTPSINLKSFAF